MTSPKFLLSFLLSAVLVGTNGHAADKAFKLTDTTVGLWNFGEGSELATPDEANSGIEMRASNMNGAVPPTLVDGKFGKALFFGGNSVLTGSQGVIETPAQVTLEAWIKLDPEAEDLEKGVFQYMAYGQCGFRMAVNKYGYLQWLIEDGTNEVAVQSKVKMDPDQWVHVAGTYDGHVSRLYINGQPEAEKDVEGGNPQGTGVPFVGLISAQGPPLFRGAIQAIRISNVALTEFDVQ